ncbi:MAG: hypothetical protein A2V93_11570 [Ignavibacteria bacterium RBG_16_34_14]|nr:MAG: hypothetical protein A2V93_11570 [Ignavibacteria bacterium RBG_16_34_14]
MPVQKFNSFEEAERALWNFNPDKEYYDRVRAFYKLFAKLSKFSYPKGIFKFRTFEEAEEHKMNAIINAASKKQ